MKSAMGDLTDRSNRAEGYAFMPSEHHHCKRIKPDSAKLSGLLEYVTSIILHHHLVTPLQASVGPLIGGSLARPSDRFPRLFSGRFWQEYPYFLPCLVTGSFVFLAWFVVLVFFKEVRRFPRRSAFIPNGTTDGPLEKSEAPCLGGKRRHSKSSCRQSYSA